MHGMKEQDIINSFNEIPEEGDIWFLISKKWVKKWKSYCGVDGEKSDDHPGPIDNSDLLENDLKTLKPHLLDDAEYTLIPKASWIELVGIYKTIEHQFPIPRKVITVGSLSKREIIEVYPPKISFKRHGSDEIFERTFSRVTSVEKVHEKIRELLKITSSKTRLHIEDSVDAIKMECSLDENSIGSTQVLVLEEQNSDGSWPRSAVPPSYDEATNTTTYKKENQSTTSFMKSASNSTSSYSTRSCYDGMANKTKQGLCGLSNLGNTCFMSSAIQCLSNVPRLTRYFKKDEYKQDINKDNPLGMGGRLAEAYATLIKEMWSGHNSYVAPRDFKYNVSRFAPQFSGYQQHDSQELMAFLIDGLHEDLNKIDDKPYVELKDSNGRPDHVVAKEAWGNHLKRNVSIIVDIFHGLFKSTLVCPDCDRVSVTFDPFGYLSLPLPRCQEVSVICHFVPKDSKKPITKYNVSAPKDGCFNDVLTRLASMVGCSAKCLVVTDVYNHRFYKIYKGQERLSSYSERDDLFVFELESNSNGEVEYTKVYMRQSSSKYSSHTLFGHPFLIPVEPGVTTYRKLYNSFLHAIKRYIKPEYLDQVDMLQIKDEVKQGDGDPEINDGNIAEEETKWFKLVTVNSWGSTVLRELEDEDEPLKFSTDTCYSAEWDGDICEKYAVEDWSQAVLRDPSMSEKRGRGITLAQCMNLFTTEEKLGEDDPWYCPGCKEHKQATKKIDLWSLPPFLIIHLKRFSYSRWSRNKISGMVDFPKRDWDLSDFIINPEKSKWDKRKLTYDLIGVSNHYGGMGGGHYTAYAYNHLTKSWHYFDDSSVSESSEDQVQTNAAYMLMYQRQDMRDHADGDINFLNSLTSPRGIDHRPFSYDTEATSSNGHHNSDGPSNSCQSSLSDDSEDEQSMMDTS